LLCVKEKGIYEIKLAHLLVNPLMEGDITEWSFFIFMLYFFRSALWVSLKTFIIDKWDIHTKEKRHTKKYVVWGFYISKNINIIIII
jgi:hypothetical protein